MLNVICFSKDRPMQLHAYIESLLHFSDIKEEYVYILYTETQGINYDAVIAHFPKIHWVKEQNFYRDLLNVVEKAENFILFGCDDVFFKDFFDINLCIKQLVRNDDIFGFSLRMGLNLKYVSDVVQEDNLITWNWAKTNHPHWNYPWDVSASVYRKSFVLDYLKSDTTLTNPNRFEAYLMNHINQNKEKYKPLLAAFDNSKCLTLTVNRVQDEFPNEFDNSASSDLQTLFLSYTSGKQLDWYKFRDTKNRDIHVDASYFSLTEAQEYPKQDLVLVQKNTVTKKIKINIRWKIWYWRIFIFLRESVRPILPRHLLQFLRKFV